METGNHVADQMETLKVRAFIRAHTPTRLVSSLMLAPPAAQKKSKQGTSKRGFTGPTSSGRMASQGGRFRARQCPSPF